MDCRDVRTLLLDGEQLRDAGLDQHLRACAGCSGFRQRLDRLDVVLRSELVVEPPPALKLNLARLSGPQSKRTAASSLWHRLSGFGFGWVPALVQFVVVAALVYSGFQSLMWLSSTGLELGDVPYALSLLVSSPAAAYANELAQTGQQLLMGLLVGCAAWLVAREYALARRDRLR